MIVIAGATQADDTRSISRGLAEAAQGVGQRVGYLKLGSDGSGDIPSASYASLSVANRGSARESFDSALASWRTMYDIVVVDAGVLGKTSLGAHAARIADGVVIGVYEKRPVVPADREMARLLNELGASIIGAVTTGSISRADAVRQSRSQTTLRAAAQP